MLIPENIFSVKIDNFISPPPSAAGIIDHFLTIISLEINTVIKSILSKGVTNKCSV